MESIKNVLATLPPTTNTKHPRNTTPPIEDKKVENNYGVINLRHTFGAFRPEPGTEAALAAMKNHATGKSDHPLVLIYGGVGNGKTHLLEATVLTLNLNHVYTNYYTFAQVIRNLKACMRDGSPITVDEMLNRLSTCRSLIIDDIGSGTHDTAWQNAMLEDIVDRRYHAELLTAMTTNKKLEDLPPRVVSRFGDKAVSVRVLNAGKDYRKGRE